jgi:hypothetical protein
MTDRATRIGLNEALFREVNERVHTLGNEAGERGVLTIVCECGAETCIAELEIEGSAYEQLRADPALFAIARGHEAPDVEDVVEQNDAYDVVRKRPGRPEQIARETR